MENLITTKRRPTFSALGDPFTGLKLDSLTVWHSSSVQFSSVTIFMSRASLIIQDYDGCGVRTNIGLTD